MPSIVHGPGNREGQVAEPPARPTSAWECLASKVQGLEVAQQRRLAMLMLRIVCAWRLEDIGQLFDLHKGHVSREIERARLEAAAILQEAGVGIGTEGRKSYGELKVRAQIMLTRDDFRSLMRLALAAGVSVSHMGYSLMVAGGLLLGSKEYSRDAKPAA